MSFPVQFWKVEAIALHIDPAKVLVKWSLMPNKEKLSDYEFYIYREEAADAEPGFQHKTIDGLPLASPPPSTRSKNLELIAGPINGLELHEYADYSLALRNLLKQLNYRVTCRKISTQEEIESKQFTWEGSLDLVGLYIADEENFLLEDSTGEPTLIHQRKRGGAICPLCFDPVQKKRLNSHCTSCFGTNWVGGFYKPVDAYVDYNPLVNQSTIQEWGETQDRVSLVKLANYPLLNQGDLLREVRRQRLWRVVKTTLTEKRRVPLLQFTQVVEINPGDIEYQVPYDEDLVRAMIEKFNEMRSRREF